MPYFRLVGGAGEEEEVLSEACVPHMLVFTRWQHLAVTLNEHFYSHRSTVNVSEELLP